jgi:hypothetical protein
MNIIEYIEKQENLNMKIKFTASELRLLNIWIDGTVHGGHYGDGDIVFPDEMNLIERLLESHEDMDIEISSRDRDILLIWAASSTDMPEELMLFERLKKMEILE